MTIILFFLILTLFDSDTFVSCMEKEENSSSSSSNRAVISHPPGLYNPGRHCYLNALLQNLFNIKAFRWCILNFQSKPPLDSTIVALKNIFENMLRGYVTNAGELLDSLSWSEEKKQEQGDSAEAFDEIWNKVNEFSKDSPFHAMMRVMFSFSICGVIASTDGVDKKAELQKWNRLQLNVLNCTSLEDSLTAYFEIEDGKYTYRDGEKPKESQMVRTFHTLPPVLVTTFERRGEIEIVHAEERKDRVYISTYSGHRVVIPHVIDLGECVLTDVNRHDLADSMTRSLQKERSLPKINNFAKVEEYQRQPIRKRLTAEEKAERDDAASTAMMHTLRDDGVGEGTSSGRFKMSTRTGERVAQLKEKGEYQYILSGVVVHTGGAAAGHNQTFVRNFEPLLAWLKSRASSSSSSSSFPPSLSSSSSSSSSTTHPHSNDGSTVLVSTDASAAAADPPSTTIHT